MLKPRHSRFVERKRLSIIRRDPAPNVLNQRNKQFSKMQQHSRRVDNLPTTSAVEARLSASAAIIHAASGDHSCLDAARIHQRMVAREHILKEFDVTDVEPPHGPRRRTPLTHGPNTTPERSDFSLERHHTRVQPNRCKRTQRPRRGRRTSSCERARHWVRLSIQLVRTLESARPQIILQRLINRDLHHAGEHTTHILVNFVHTRPLAYLVSIENSRRLIPHIPMCVDVDRVALEPKPSHQQRH